MADEMGELIGFLAPGTRLDVRRAALEYVVGVSGQLDGSASALFQDKDFRMGKALVELCEQTASDRSQTLAALTNFASGSAAVAEFILKSKVPNIAYVACKTGAPYATFSARLLANVSRHLPDRTQDVLEKQDPECLVHIIDLLSKQSEDSFSALLGYVIVNLSQLPRVRRKLVDDGQLDKLYALVTQDKDSQRRSVAADVLRNMCFEDGLHARLLESDDLLVALLTPLADSGDDIDSDDMEHLPTRMQWFEGSREQDGEIRQKLIEALYQLCATSAGRCKLRDSGVYFLMRELDKATRPEEDPNAPPPKMRPPQLLAQEEHTLHALIGMLIKYEEDMGVDTSVSLRELE